MQTLVSSGAAAGWEFLPSALFSKAQMETGPHLSDTPQSAQLHQGHVRAPFHPHIIPLEMKLSTLMYLELIFLVLKCKLG